LEAKNEYKRIVSDWYCQLGRAPDSGAEAAKKKWRAQSYKLLPFEMLLGVPLSS